ncbi:MAG: glycosyltransferase family 2 protein [Sphingorhabdus sp.]|uniref:glycosyltransferase family 2 protein n=1 Tax=Sphingorhabdus sp. TaxID=1902408 RepID=UPI0025E7EB37|nr:glycosyltransferase family 2 protein [Sphingorhabdus sp.]MCO4090763.1 glycosyltransferase family 2 protein [Sphingorhabdus sp.]
MKTKPLLTILVPTYNRSENLAVLLRALHEEVAQLDTVTVFVSDNASTDSTPLVVDRVAKEWPNFASFRHPENIGADENFLHCVRSVQTRWLWIIGDDDLPKRGILSSVIQLLEEKEPALVYMQSEWVDRVCSPDQGELVQSLNIRQLNALSFASTVHTWLTYISAMVIDKRRLTDVIDMRAVDRYNRTSLVQLGWILPLLMTDGPFFYVKNKCVLATSGNTGGYQVFKVFFQNFPQIIDNFFGKDSSIGKSILKPHFLDYLPRLAWNLRFKNIGKFQKEDLPTNWSNAIGKNYYRQLLVRPIIALPRPLAWPFYIFAQFLRRLNKTD